MHKLPYRKEIAYYTILPYYTYNHEFLFFPRFNSILWDNKISLLHHRNFLSTHSSFLSNKFFLFSESYLESKKSKRKKMNNELLIIWRTCCISNLPGFVPLKQASMPQITQQVSAFWPLFFGEETTQQ